MHKRKFAPTSAHSVTFTVQRLICFEIPIKYVNFVS